MILKIYIIFLTMVNKLEHKREKKHYTTNTENYKNVKTQIYKLLQNEKIYILALFST